MCGRYNEKKVAKSLEKDYGITIDIDSYKERINVAPHDYRRIITNLAPAKVTLAWWNLFPDAKRPVTCSRHETILESLDPELKKTAIHSTYRKLLSTSRCLIPVAGYYEWKELGRQRIPFYVSLKSQEMFFVAGIYKQWEDKLSFSVLTIHPSDFMLQVHDRMPVILHGDKAMDWLHDMDLEEALRYCKPYEPKDMHAWQLHSRANSGAYQEEDAIAPLQSGLMFDGSKPVEQLRLGLFG